MPRIIPPKFRRVITLLLLSGTLTLTAALAIHQASRHIHEAAEDRGYELREVQESLSSLHRDLAMVNLLVASSGTPNAAAVTDYLMARRNEFSPVRWLAYVPAPGEPPQMLLGSAVMARFDHRHDAALTALLDHASENNPAVAAPDTYRNVASLAMALQASNVGKGRPTLLALIDVDDLLRDTMREIDHLPLHFELNLGTEFLGQWPRSVHHDPKRPHTVLPLSLGTARFTLTFGDPDWADIVAARWPLPLTIFLAGLTLTAAWLLGSRTPRHPNKPGREPVAPTAPITAIDLRAAQMDRLWQLGEMTSSLGHDLGQPLNIIRLTAEAAQDAIDRNRADPDRIRRSLNTAIDQTRRMQGMIDTLVSGTRRPVDPPEPVQPVAAVRRALSATLPRLRSHGIRLHWHADLKTPAVLGHSRRLQLAVINLLINAADALAGAALDAQAEPGLLRVSCHGGDGGITIVVEDNGQGITP
ncbi:MAG: hypothetical protein K2X44_09235, partial [Magnetospirillum sp.]|nr:hypothetical protein [Magnetospirillum sp.]